MAFYTFKQMTDAVIKEAGLVNGSAVQTYVEPQVQAAIQSIFDLLMNKPRRWEHITQWETWTLNGTTGLVTNNITVKNYEDIKEVRISNTNRKVLQSSDTAHLYATGNFPLYRTQIRWNDGNVSKLVKFWPINATGSVDVLVSYVPDPFVKDTDIIPFNPLVVKLGALWYLLAGDGLNPGNAEKAQGLFDVAYNDYVSKLNSGDIGYGAHYDQDALVLR